VRDEADLIVLKGQIGWVNSVAFSPDGAFVVAGGVDGSVRLWKLPGLHNLATRERKASTIVAVSA
jgi:WD40 repeat protein